MVEVISLDQITITHDVALTLSNTMGNHVYVVIKELDSDNVFPAAAAKNLVKLNPHTLFNDSTQYKVQELMFMSSTT